MDNSNQYKVRLESYSHGTSTVATSQVIFNVMPTISETISVEYQSLDPIHMPGSFFVYKGTKSSTFEMGDLRLVSRTPSEASTNQAIRNTLRGWTKPYFGFGTANGSSTPTSQTKYEYQQREPGLGLDPRPLTPEDVTGIISSFGDTTGVGVPTEFKNAKMFNLTPAQRALAQTDPMKQKAQAILTKLNSDQSTQYLKDKTVINPYVRVPVGQEMVVQSGKQFLGAPPEVLYLTAYSDPAERDGQLDRTTNLYRIPVVISNLSITYPNDVDYIPTLQGEPFPIIMSISLSLLETHSPKEFEDFDIFKYRDGKLPGF